MTRINLVDPTELTDQHLIAEYKEIRQLCGALRRTLESKSGFQESKVPSEFKLNKGHVYFFYNKGKYIHDRYQAVRTEMLDRGYKPNHDFPHDVWPSALYNDWEPTERDKEIVRERIALRISEKPDWYRYRGQPVPST